LLARGMSLCRAGDRRASPDLVVGAGSYEIAHQASGRAPGPDTIHRVFVLQNLSYRWRFKSTPKRKPNKSPRWPSVTLTTKLAASLAEKIIIRRQACALTAKINSI